jgi:hypothetical protein
MNNLIATLITIAGSAVLLLFGIIYLTRPRFMGYHRIAVQKEWNELIPGIQTLILALMRTVSGGFISISIAIVILQLEFNRTHDHWIALTILIIGGALNLCILYANLLVRTKTRGRPPAIIPLLLLIMLLISYFLNISG